MTTKYHSAIATLGLVFATLAGLPVWGPAIPAQSRQPASEASLSLVPPTTSVQSGDVFTLTIAADTGANFADTADAYIDFDPDYLEVVGESGEPATTIEPNAEIFTFVTVNTVDNGAGQINFSGTNLVSSLTGDFPVATVRFRAAAPVNATAVAFVRSGARTSDLYWSGDPLNATLGDATVTISDTCPRKREGDANCDGKIDGVDYSIWLNHLCDPGQGQVCVDLRADFNNDGKVDIYDERIWSNNRACLQSAGGEDATASSITLALYPTAYAFALNEVESYELRATFTNGSLSETLDYLRTEVSFPPQYLTMPDYVNISPAPFNFILRVTNPIDANQTGIIIIELGTYPTPGSGPSTVEEITIAKIELQGVTQTPYSLPLTMGCTQVVNNQSQVIPASTQGASFTVVCYDFMDPPGIGIEDVQILANRWRQASSPPFDCDNDGVITVRDIMCVVKHWGETCS